MRHYRWVICGLLFFATTINYMDRQVIGLLKPTLEKSLGWSEIDYGHIVFAFSAAYALGYLLAGRVMDRLGVRRGFSLAVVVWSLAATAHGLARSVLGFGARGRRWVFRKGATFRPRSRPCGNGFPNASGPWRPAFSTPGATWARWLRP